MAHPELFSVVGHPVTHSLSPVIHRFWYQAAGLNAAYHALDLQSDTPVADLKALARAGFKGLNVTLPHKLSALEAASEMSDAARLIGAANTLLLKGEGPQKTWYADNTDWTGFLWSLDRVCETLPESAVLIGAGGAARGVAYALSQRGVKLTILNRTLEKAEVLIKDLNLSDADIGSLDEINRVCAGHTLVINTVSLGHTGQSISLPPTQNGVFLDISYGQAASETLRLVQESGWKTEDGLPMLIGQAADAFHLWFGLEPDREAALTHVRKAGGN